MENKTFTVSTDLVPTKNAIIWVPKSDHMLRGILMSRGFDGIQMEGPYIAFKIETGTIPIMTKN